MGNLLRRLAISSFRDEYQFIARQTILKKKTIHACIQLKPMLRPVPICTLSGGEKPRTKTGGKVT